MPELNALLQQDMLDNTPYESDMRKITETAQKSNQKVPVRRPQPPQPPKR